MPAFSRLALNAAAMSFSYRTSRKTHLRLQQDQVVAVNQFGITLVAENCLDSR